jgi:hypothetical protein
MVGGFGRRDIGWIGVGMGGTKLVQREHLVPAFLLLPGQDARQERVPPDARPH